MREKIARPLKLSDDFENNLYRNVVHVLVECEKMIPGGQAERIISVAKALFREEIEKVKNPYNSDIQGYHWVGWQVAHKKILALLKE